MPFSSHQHLKVFKRNQRGGLSWRAQNDSTERSCYHKLWLRFRNAGMENKMLCKGDSNLITWVVWCSKKETKPALQVLDGPPELNRQERDAPNTIYYETEEEKINKPLIAWWLYPLPRYMDGKSKASNQPKGRKKLELVKNKFANLCCLQRLLLAKRREFSKQFHKFQTHWALSFRGDFFFLGLLLLILFYFFSNIYFKKFHNICLHSCFDMNFLNLGFIFDCVYGVVLGF